MIVMENNAGVLSDIKVLDLSQGVAGPFCAKFLAGLGAEVIKVEPPFTGDSSRQSEPIMRGESGLELSALFAYLNTSKKSVTLDLETPGQAESVKRLAQENDILVESFAPGYLESLGLGYDSLAEINPGLIYVSVTPFGQSGPYRPQQAVGMAAHMVEDQVSGLEIRVGTSVAEGRDGGEYETGIAIIQSLKAKSSVLQRDRRRVLDDYIGSCRQLSEHFRPVG
jgi:hypothetical protein